MAFRFQSVSRLFKDLGRYDAIVEFTEVSIRDFLFEANKNGNFDSYLTSKSTQHNVYVNTVDKSVFRSRISQGYILSVYQAMELCIRNFKHDYNDLYFKDKKFDDTTDSLLIKLIKIIGDKNHCINVIGEYRIYIYDYYRMVRNKYSHDIIEESKIEKAYRELLIYYDEIKLHYPSLSAPNPYTDIEFDDFIFFSRVVKEIITSLNDFAAPTDNQLSEYYIHKKLYSELNQKLDRKANAYIGHMRANFGIDKARAENIVSLVMSH